MKLSLTSLFLFGLVTALSPLSPCPQYQVANVNGICIQPFYIQGCQTYLDTDRCGVCKSGYQLNTVSKCDTINPSNVKPPVGCLSDSQGICSNCATGFRLQNGACLKGVLFCEAYRTDGTCGRCNNLYSLVLNQCKKSNILGCKIVNPDNKQLCDQCIAPFMKTSSGKCAIQKCKTYNDYGCTHCECQYGLKNDGTCQKLSRHCAKNNQGKCVYCLKNYQLNSMNQCVMVGCASQDSHGVCVQCMSGFVLTNNLKSVYCKRQNCRVWDDAICKSCETGYYLVQGFCVKSPQTPFTCTA